jgi:RimJ/RimL family protein N-acetyltransferase
MKLKELTLENCEQVRQWRNECLEVLRTPFLLTEEMQQRFYEETISNRNARARYWGVWGTKTFDNAAIIAQMKANNAAWQNGSAEERIRLTNENLRLGFSMGWTRDSSGVWYKPEDTMADAEYVPNVNLDTFIGMVGLENIEWENRRAEISIILDPEYRGKGFGEQAVNLLLEQGFFFMNLEIIWGECYTCNPALQFWKKIAKKYLARCADIPFTKFWKYQYYDSFYFAFLKEDYNYVRNNT